MLSSRSAGTGEMNTGGASTELNISFVLPPDLTQSIVEVNKSFDRRTGSNIRFAVGDDPPVPHITLLMGTVRTACVTKLLALVQQWTEETSPLLLTLGETYKSSRRSRFVFVEVQSSDELKALRMSLHREAADFLNIEAHGGPDNASHVTVAHLQRLQPVSDRERCALRGLTQLATQVQVGLRGEHGTVSTILSTFDLRGAFKRQVQRNDP